MSKIYLISDLHLGDENILRYENRPFKCVEDMDNTIINNCKEIVKPEDTLIIAGDVSNYDENKTRELISSVSGYKVLVIGNHDVDDVKYWQRVGFDEVSRYDIIINEFFIVSHKPKYLNSNMPYANIHGHIHSLKYESKQFFNVSVECINYKPIDLEEIKRIVTSK